MERIEEPALLSIAYIPNIQYITKFILHKKIIIDIGETYLKQSYRNRCEIYGSNGPLSISIPVIKKNGNRTKTKDILNEYDTEWGKIHWKAITSAYGNSPFFEIFEPELAYLFSLNDKYLVDFNLSILEQLFKSLGLSFNYELSDIYIPEGTYKYDFRNSISPKRRLNILDSFFNPQKYFQVFSDKYGFIDNLSFIDLMFNEGPQTADLCVKSINTPAKNNK